MRVIPSSDRAAVLRLLAPSRRGDPKVARRVRTIVSAVRREGDGALVRFAKELDGFSGAVEMSAAEVGTEARRAHPDLRRAIRTAASHIRRVARRQLPRGFSVTVAPGVTVEQRVVPLARVGCCVPGGRHPLPSSLLMTAIAARVAGVGEVFAVCPRPSPAVCAAAIEAKVTRLFRIGGAHAVAALAYGTRSVPRVDKIVGPGNAWVTAAKTAVAGDCPIDMEAGPSEIAIVSASGPAAWMAADLVAQAEHDPDVRALLFTPNRTLARAVAAAVDALVGRFPAARPALGRRSAIVLTRDLDDAIALANLMAPEHAVCDTMAMAKRLVAGTVFVGARSAQAAGDYATGSNHVLPTGGTARRRGGLAPGDFVRTFTVQRLTGPGLEALGPTAVILARAEGLLAHAHSIEVRLP
jgi:histidinol dehydrogenase